MRNLAFVILLLLFTQSAAAQLAERPLPPTLPVGIVYPAAVGSMTGNNLKQDQLKDAAIAEVEQTLRQLGYQVVPRSDVILKLNDSGIQCPSGVYNCAPLDVLRTLKLGAVVLLAIWWNRTPADITIEVTTADSVGSAKGKLEDDVRRSVPALVTSALRDLPNGKAVEVQIKALPVGAEVHLDGELLGTAPVSAKARPGAHEVTLRYPGYATTSQHFEVRRGAPSPLLVDVAMERADANATRKTDAPMESSSGATPVWDYILGGVLAAATVGLAVSPIRTLADSADCEQHESANGRCSKVTLGSRSGLQLAGSAVALGGAIYVFAARPIQAALLSDRGNVYVQLTSSF